MPTTIEIEDEVAVGIELASEPAAPLARHKETAQPVLSVRASVRKSEARTFIAGALHDIRLFMHEHDVEPAGPPFSICTPHGRDLDIEAGWPTLRPLIGTNRIHAGALPPSLIGRNGKLRNGARE